MKGTFEVGSVEETWALARRLAAELKPGDVVCLEGDLGAGKTTFSPGLAAALGAKRAVTSPTFCLVVEHPTEKFLLVHMDLYRLHDADDVLTIGWEDYLARNALVPDYRDGEAFVTFLKDDEAKHARLMTEAGFMAK